MGVNLGSILSSRPISFKELKGKVIAIDALNSIYQFLSSIRQSDGTPLMDSHGRITSHLSGIFYRTIRLVECGIRPIYVFDGESPKQKKKELDNRRALKESAERQWKMALKDGRMDDARKFASRTSRFTDDMRGNSQRLLDAMGIPWIQAPSEGEAQCAYICQKGDAWAVGSQDYDSILMGAKRLVRGLTIGGHLHLEIIETDKILRNLGIDRHQLIDMAILIGTDFNPGVRGIGPKKALKIVKEGSLDNMKLDFDPDPIKRIFLKPVVEDNYKIIWNSPKKELIIDLLCHEYEFSVDRIERGIEKLSNAMGEFSQQDIRRWF